MKHHLAQIERFLQVFAALANQRVVGADLDPKGLQLDSFREHVRGAIEERTGEHPRLHSLLLRIFLAVEGASRLFKARPRNVDAVLDVVEQPSRQRLDQPLLGRQSVGRRFVGLDPVAIIEDPPLAAHHALCAVGGCVLVAHRRWDPTPARPE